MADWTITREDGVTFCEDAHPIRLGKNPEHYPGEPWERDEAIRRGARGYRCPGGHEHLYPVWIVYDAAHPNESNRGTFDVYMEARALRDRLRDEEP